MSNDLVSLARGRDVIKKMLESLGHSSGVYRMIDAQGAVLYVGKAKQLKSRVANYTQVNALPNRLQRMVAHTASMEIITTRSEAEALLMEANLIKKFVPRYNILLKDDKSFPYIFFSGDHPYPRIEKHRGGKNRKGRYFGPFVSAGAVNETLAVLQKAFLLRPCSDAVFKHRTRPCLQYQIKRCSAPCVGYVSEADYAGLVAEAESFLKGKGRELQEALVREMQHLSANMEFEKAGILRDRIRALTSVQTQQRMITTGIEDADIMSMVREGADTCIQLFSIRGGMNFGNRSWFPAHAESVSESELLSTFIGQYYQSHLPPALLLLSHPVEGVEVLEEALSLRAERKVEVACPQRGSKREAVVEALSNTRGALERHRAQKVAEEEALARVQQLFGLDEVPARIEVYDNSHISGTNAVGAMIVAGPEGFIKTEYRSYTIRHTPGDDYGMMREVFTRRFQRALSEGSEAKWPDLVLIDGGAGQLSTAMSIFEELGIQEHFKTVAISKGEHRNAGREWLHRVGHEPLQLEHADPTLHYLQRLRDEAHRFAIGAHRNKRSGAMTRSVLEEIPGIGSARKRALLHFFGSAKSISAASVDELARVPGINQSTAEKIYAHFHG